MKTETRRLGVVFLIGLLGGAAMGAGGVRFRFKRAADPEARQARLLARFTKRLDLSPEQREKVSAVIKERRVTLEAIQAEVNPRLEAARKASSEEIRKLLTAEQQPKYDEIRDRWEKRRRERGERGGPPR